MSIRTCFITFNYLLAALAIGCLSFVETFSMLTLATLLIGLAICMFYEFRKILPVKPPVGVSLLKAGLVILPVVYFTIRLSMVDFTVYALAFILITRFIFKTELNDYLFGYLIAIVCMLAGAIFTQGLVFGLIFLSFYLTLCWNLIFYNMLVERAGSQAPPDMFKSAGGNEKACGSLFILTGSMVAVSLLMTAAIFVAFPRLGLGFMSIASKSSPVSGFSDSVQLGDVGKIKLNESVVMRVEFSKNSKTYHPKSKILWRGVTLDFYKDQKWTTTVPRVLKIRNHSGSGVNLFASNSPTNVVQHDIYMEAFGSSIIFTHGIPLKMSGNFRDIEIDQSYALRTSDKGVRPKRFTLISDIGHPDASYAYPVPLGEPGPGHGRGNKIFPERFLQLPSLAPRIVQLSNEIANSAGSDRTIAENILKHLRNNYGYSLEMVHKTGMSGLDEFLFVNKKGHCEYFASAMAILLRLNNIPARMVNGFSGGEWNDLGDYMIVRQKHAHSWVEAYLPGEGWMVFDPTPSDPSAANASSSRLSHSIDLMRLYWQRYVVKYTLKDQAHILEFFNRGGRGMFQKLKSFKTANKEDIGRYLREHLWVLLAAAGIILLIILQKNNWFRGALSSSRLPFAVTLYQQMLKRCSSLGIHKKSGWTHTEFLTRTAGLPQEKADTIKKITHYYELCRFGARPALAKDKKEMQALLKNI